MAKLPAPKVPGLVKGLGVTFKTMARTTFPARGMKTLIPAPSKVRIGLEVVIGWKRKFCDGFQMHG